MVRIIHKTAQKVHKDMYRQRPEVKVANQKTMTKLRLNHKMALIAYKRGVCARCGLVATEDNACAFDFHHANPDEKEYRYTLSMLSLEKAKKEVDKCIMVCAVCHRILHWRDADLEAENAGGL